MGYNWNKVDRMSTEAAKEYLRRRYYKGVAKKRNANKEDRLAWSLMDSERFVSDPDGGCTYYGFIIGEDFADTYDVETTFDLTDEEIREWINSHMWISNYSPYDCTGEEFTCWIDWHRNPCGVISYVHRTALDI